MHESYSTSHCFARNMPLEWPKHFTLHMESVGDIEPKLNFEVPITNNPAAAEQVLKAYCDDLRMEGWDVVKDGENVGSFYATCEDRQLHVWVSPALLR